MSKSIRVSALAKELGMASKDVVDLCKSIGVGVMSASSTMYEDQADRVRHHAEVQGLKREPAPEKPKRAERTESEKANSAAADTSSVEAAPSATATPTAPLVAPPTSEWPLVAYTQSEDFSQRFERYEGKVGPEKLVATALVAATDSTLTLVIKWTHRRAKPEELVDELDDTFNELRPNKAMNRLMARMARFPRLVAHRKKLRLEVMGVEGATFHDFDVVDGVLRIRPQEGDERLQVTEENQQLIFTLFFVGPTTKKQTAVAFYGRTTARPGEMTTYVKAVQEVLDSLQHLEPLKGALSPRAANVSTGAATESTTSSSTVESGQGLAAPKFDLQARVKQLVAKLKTRPWLQRCYVLEFLAIWLGLFFVFFDPDWRVLLPLPLTISVLALLGPVFEGRVKRGNLAGMSRSSLARVMSIAGAIGLIGTQIGAIISVPINDTPKVSLWVFLSMSQLRIVYGVVRRHLSSLREGIESYLLTANWVEPGEYFGRYEERIATLRTQSPIEAEAEPQIALLIRLYYGVIAAVFIVITYFVIGERFAAKAENSDFIFVNNEGFTAALALLIILISTVAVQMFTDLAGQIRLQDERFESDVSKLAIGLGNEEVALGRVWGHFVDYLPDVSRAVNAELSEIWESFEERQREMVRQIVTGPTRPPTQTDEMINALVRTSESTVVQAWLKDGWFDNTARLRNLSAAEFLAAKFSWRHTRSSGYSRRAMLTASMPADENQSMSMFALERINDEELDKKMQAVRVQNEVYLLALCLKTSRYLTGASGSDSHKLVSDCCNALDIDASYFLDDRILFSEIVASARQVDAEGSKKDSRGSLKEQQAIRDAEVARVLFFAAWLSQINSYASTPLQRALNVRHLEPGEDKTEYTMNVLSKTIPNVFKHDAHLNEAEVTELLKDPEKAIEHFKWLMRVSLQDPQSALHCLTRAALARDRRQLLIKFETNTDRWRAQRILSLPIVPRYQDRVNHLAAVLGIGDRAQSGLRLRSVNDVIKLPESSAQMSLVSTWALQQHHVDCDLPTARRFQAARGKWAELTNAVGQNNMRRRLAFTLEDLAFKQQVVNNPAAIASNASIQTIGNSAFDGTRMWYQQNNFRWNTLRENYRSQKQDDSFHFRFWKYHCLLSAVFCRTLISIEEFREDTAKRIREVIVTVDPTIGDLLNVRPLTPTDRGVVNSEQVITEVVNFCLAGKNNQTLLGQSDSYRGSEEARFFNNLDELERWRSEANGVRRSVMEFVDDFAEDFDDDAANPEENVASSAVGDTALNNDNDASN